MIELCCEYLSVWCIYLYVLVMSRTHFRVKTQLNHFASLAKWLNVRLQSKWLWVRVQLQSLIVDFFFFFMWGLRNYSWSLLKINLKVIFSNFKYYAAFSDLMQCCEELF